jgi:3-oxoacyl-[acyl-carrier protein] reductase
VSRDADVARLVQFALAHFGGLHVVVNNAGTTHRNQPMLDVSEEMFDRIYQVNVKSLFLTAKHAVPHFRRSATACFVTIASTAGVRPRPGSLVQRQQGRGDRDVAVDGRRARARQHSRQHHQSGRRRDGDARRLHGEDTPQKRAQFVASIPLGRLSQPSDVATAAVFFASAEAAFITGACLEVDGGRCI